MSIENIIEKILKEAQEEGSQVLEKANHYSLGVMEKAKQQAENILKEAEEQGREDALLLKKRRLSVADLEVRKMRLSAKQAAISRSFSLALDKLANMKEEDYLRLLADTVSAIGAEGGELLLNPKDREKIGQKVVEMVNKSGKAGTVTLSQDTIGARGGFVLRKGAVEINSTLETMVSAVREDVTPEVVRVLFG